MLKILIVASTESVLKYKDKFVESGFSFDFLIGQKNSMYDFGQISDQKVSIDNEMIPIDDHQFLRLQTPSIHLKKEKAQQELKSLKHILFQRHQFLNKTENIIQLKSSATDLSETVFYFDEINDLSLNEKSNKIYLEIKNTGLRQYDHIYFENSHLNLNQISNRFSQQNFFKMNDRNLFQFIGIKFNTNSSLGERNFWLMSDVNYKSIYDNFYYLKTSNNELDVWTWMPIQQVSNPTSISYLAQRIQKKIEKKFDFMTLAVVSTVFLKQPINTYLDVINKSKNLVSFIPHYHFYSTDQIAQSLLQTNNKTIAKMKIKKDFIQADRSEATL